MLLFVVITVFIAGLMVGRTPEYVGKKIEASEVKMAMLAILILPLMYLGWTAVAVVYPPAVASMANAGPHGFTEVLYAYTSQTANNGSAFAGLTGNTPFYNLTGALSMLVGRFWMIVPAMAIAGSLAGKKTVAASGGTFPTTGGAFCRPARRRDPDRRRPHVLPGARARTRSSSISRCRPARRSEPDRLEKRPWKPRNCASGCPRPHCLIPTIILPAIGQAFVKLDPRSLAKNPVMFVLEVVTLLTTFLLVRDIVTGEQHIGFEIQIVIWLWFTVLFANFAEAVAEGRGKAQADTLRKTRTETRAKRILSSDNHDLFEGVSAEELETGDLVVCEAGDVIPGDGEVIEGIASVNEAAITGESAPVIRESGGDRSAVTGGTTVISDRIVVRITASAGSSFLDRMIKLVEGAERQKTPNEIALNILLVGLTIIFVFATATHPKLRRVCGRHDLGHRAGGAVRHADPDHHRRAAVGDRHRRHGPAGTLQCAGDVGPRRRGGGRRGYAAARQDRHGDVRQPARDRDHSGRRA